MCLTQKFFQFRFGAIRPDPEGLSAVEGENSHEAGGIHLKPVGTNLKQKPLLTRQGHKILHIPQRPEPHLEFPHIHPPKAVQNRNYRV